MLPQARIDALTSLLPSDLQGLLSKIYAIDTATGMLKIDRNALLASGQKPTLETAVSQHGFAATQFHNPETTYQYYDMSQLWQDISTATDAGLRHIHLTSEPLKAAAIHQHLLGQEMPQSTAKIHHEDMRTKHADIWGRTGPYLMGASEVLNRLTSFFTAQKAR